MDARGLVAETTWRRSPLAVVELPEQGWYGIDADGFTHMPRDREALTGASAAQSMKSP